MTAIQTDQIEGTSLALQSRNGDNKKNKHDGDGALRIAQIAPLAEPVPPGLYGGTERIVSALTEGLVAQGHHVTLFASGDSQTASRLVACREKSLRLDPSACLKEEFSSTLNQLGEVYRRANEFDIIHSHVDYFAFPFARLSSTPTVSTVHGRLDLSDIQLAYEEFPEHQLISISRNQATYLPDANWVGNVYNGIDPAQSPFGSSAGDYLVFLGRISPEKRPDRAIEIARDVGMRLVIAAKVDSKDQAYFDHAIKPLIQSSPLIEFVGEVNQEAKAQLLAGAYAYLFPIDWPEPFGITMIESLAAGTPVITTRSGAVPEIIVHGETGFICDSFGAMVEAVHRVADLDRARCRRHVEENFSVDAMVSSYENVYRSVLDGRQAHATEIPMFPLADARNMLEISNLVWESKPFATD